MNNWNEYSAYNTFPVENNPWFVFCLYFQLSRYQHYSASLLSNQDKYYEHQKQAGSKKLKRKKLKDGMLCAVVACYLSDAWSLDVVWQSIYKLHYGLYCCKKNLSYLSHARVLVWDSLPYPYRNSSLAWILKPFSLPEFPMTFCGWVWIPPKMTHFKK